MPAPAQTETAGDRVDESVPAFLRRLRPTKAIGVAYLWGLFAALLLVGLLAVVNVLVPLADHAIARTVATLGIVFAGWAVAMLALQVQGVRAFRPAVLFSLGAVPVTVLVGTLGVWELGPAKAWSRTLGVVWVLLVSLLMAAPATEAFARGRRLAAAGLTLAALGLAGLLLAFAIAAGDPLPRLTESAWRAAIPLFLGSFLLLLPAARRPWVPLVAWGAFLQYALVSAL